MSEKNKEASFSEAFSKLEAKSLNDQVYEKIRSAIISGVISPGTRLVLTELASSFGTSLTPVKEAIARLEVEKLIDVVPRVGTFVSHLKVEDVKELFGARLMIELYAAENSIEKITEDHLERLNQLVTDLGNHVDGDRYRNFPEYIEKDNCFHHYFVELCGNQRILKMHKELGAHLMITRAYYVKKIEGAKRANDEHAMIVRKLGERNLEDLKRTLREHINQGMFNVLQAMQDLNDDARA
jgi:DNA-binding GntR family transcriptional regulator